MLCVFSPQLSLQSAPDPSECHSVFLAVCRLVLRAVLPPPFLLAPVSWNCTCQPPLQLAVTTGLQQWKEEGERTEAWCFTPLQVSLKGVFCVSMMVQVLCFFSFAASIFWPWVMLQEHSLGHLPPLVLPNDGGTERRPEQWDSGAVQSLQVQVMGLSSGLA